MSWDEIIMSWERDRMLHGKEIKYFFTRPLCAAVQIRSNRTSMVRLTLKAPIATNVVCFSRLLNCLISLYYSVDPDETAPI